MKRATTFAVRLALLGIVATSVRADEAADARAKVKTEEANRRVVLTMYNLLMNDHKVDEALEYIDPNYRQLVLRPERAAAKTPSRLSSLGSAPAS